MLRFQSQPQQEQRLELPDLILVHYGKEHQAASRAPGLLQLTTHSLQLGLLFRPQPPPPPHFAASKNNGEAWGGILDLP